MTSLHSGKKAVAITDQRGGARAVRAGFSLPARAALLAAGVVLYALAFPPVDLFFAGFVAVAPFALAVHGARGVRFLLLAYAAGVVLFTAACAWLAESAVINLLAMALTQGFLLPLFALFYWAGVRHARLPVWLGTPVAWIAAEFVRATWPLDGFPWLLLGYTAWRVPPLLQTADLFGVWGPGFLMSLSSGVAAAFLLAWREKRAPEVGRAAAATRPAAGAVVLAVLACAAAAYGVWRPKSLQLRDGPVLAAVQGNIPQKLKHDSGRASDVFRLYLEGTRDLFRPGRVPVPDLVVWPETMYSLPISEGAAGEIWFPADRTGDAAARRFEADWIVERVIGEITGPAGAWFMPGAVSYRLGPGGVLQRRNSLFLYDPAGERRSSYSKTILVPGGEYLPWIDALPFGAAIESLVVSVAGFLPDLVPGGGVALHRLTARGEEYTFGAHICFENIYGDYARRFAAAGAQFIVNISNEGWFGASAEFDQMMAMSIFRAVETRRSLFRSTNTGISCLVSPRGEIPGAEAKVEQIGADRAVAGVLALPVPLCDASTLYARIGNALPQAILGLQALVAAAAIAGRLLVTWRSRRSTRIGR